MRDHNSSNNKIYGVLNNDTVLNNRFLNWKNQVMIYLMMKKINLLSTENNIEKFFSSIFKNQL